MTATARRVVVLLGAFGVLAAVAGYLFGAPVSATLLVPAMALVIAVMLVAGAGAAVATAMLGAAAFLFVQLAGVQRPLVGDFGSGSAPLDLPTVLGGAGATWLPTVVGVACLAVTLPVAWWLRRGLASSHPVAGAEAGGGVSVERTVAAATVEPLEVSAPAATAESVRGGETSTTGDDTLPRAQDAVLQVPTLLRLRLGVNSNGRAAQRADVRRLMDLVNDNLGEWREGSFVWGEMEKVMVLLVNADKTRAGALAQRLQEASRTRLRRPLDAVVSVLDSSGGAGKPGAAAGGEVRLSGRSQGGRVGARRAGGGR